MRTTLTSAAWLCWLLLTSAAFAASPAGDAGTSAASTSGNAAPTRTNGNTRHRQTPVSSSSTHTHPTAETGKASTRPARRFAHHAAAAKAVPAPPPVPVPAPVAAAAVLPDAAKGGGSGLPLPRFAALRSDQVSLRSGPGTRYPIDWVYQRRYLPVKIEREFDAWRLVSEPDGTKGWVHQALLTNRRGFLIDAGQPQTMRVSAADTAAAVAVLKPGVVGRLLSCPAGSDWCEVEVNALKGWLPRGAFWGTLGGETVAAP